MPIINVSITGEPNSALSQRIAEHVTELTKSHLKKDPTITAIAVHYVDFEHWFAGGRSLAAQGASTFWLDIKVVDGTNTKSEMADYIKDVFATLAEIIGGVHEESYSLIHEVPGAAYGFGGKTQEYRFVAGRIKSAA